MDESDDFESDNPETEEPITERVRIFGAETAETIAQSARSSSERQGTEAPEYEAWSASDDISEKKGPQASRYVPGEPSGANPALPHWADPPTGQVPAIIDRRGDDALSDPLTPPGGGPSWREHEHEWDDIAFEPSLLADDDTRVGAMEDRPLSERRPWEFDDFTERDAPEERPTRAPRGGRTRSWTGEPKWADDPEGEDDDGTFSGSKWWEEDTEPPGIQVASAQAASEASGSSATEDATTTRLSIPSTSGAGRDASADTDNTLVASISSSPLRSAARSAGASSSRRRANRNRRPPRPGTGSGDATGSGTGRSVPVAIATGVGFAVVALACFSAGSVAMLVLSAVVVTLAAAECYAAFRRAGRKPATLLGLVATVGVMVTAYSKGVAALPLVLALLAMTAMVWYLIGVEHGSPLEGISSTVFGFVWVGLLGSFAGLMLAPSQYPHRHGVAFLLGAVVATVAEDVGALAIGGWLGRHPLAPKVSPNKTWEGLIGGAVLAIAASVGITGQVHPWTPSKAVALGVVVAVIAPIGDLCESLIKRDLRLKDMGSLLPGHGGILDRVDGLLFVLPATYYLVRLLHLG